jgi:type II secretory pathway pseudopilin PulG
MKIPGEIRSFRQSGLTLVEIFVVVALIAFLFTVATGNLIPRSHRAPRQTCAMNIEAIEGAKQMWMMEAKKSDNDTATVTDLKPILKGFVFPVCPNGGVYSINPNHIRAVCSIHTPRPADQ